MNIFSRRSAQAVIVVALCLVASFGTQLRAAWYDLVPGLIFRPCGQTFYWNGWKVTLYTICPVWQTCRLNMDGNVTTVVCDDL